MAIKFEFYESPHTMGKRKKRYHARVVNWQHVDTDQLAREIQRGSTLSVADVKATLISLSEKLADYLKEGARVHMEGIGYFHVSLDCPETASPRGTRAEDVHFKSVTFRADKYLKKELAGLKTERSTYKRHSAVLSAEEIDQSLTDYFAQQTVLTRRDLEKWCGLTRSTACRHLTRLLDEGKLVNISIPRNPIYQPAPGFFGREAVSQP